VELSGVQESDIVSDGADPKATNPDRSCLAAKSSDYMFVYYAQPLARLRTVWRCAFSVMPQGRHNRMCSAFSMTFASRLLIEISKSDTYVSTVILATISDTMIFQEAVFRRLNRRPFRGP
jgi:hypothetical protein